MDPFLGEIRLVGFNFAPTGWAFCNGQIMSISQNTALFSLLGTTYGGDGKTTFALPDLRGRAAIGMGAGAGLNNYVQGENVALPSGQAGSDAGLAAMNYIIALQGIYPSRP